MLRTLCLGFVLWGFSAAPCRAAERGSARSSRMSAADFQATLPATTPSPEQVPASATPAEHATAHALLDEAEKLYRRGDFEQAIQEYQQVLREWPSSAEAYAGLIRVYLKKKDVERADTIVTAGLKVIDSPVLHVARGEVYFREGKIPEAEQEWVNEINSGSQVARAYLGLARVRWALSMYKSGWTLIDKAHELDPTDPEIGRLWIERLSRAERIKYLEEDLAAETNDDAETRAAMQHYLEFLKAREREPRGACHLVSKADSTDTKLVRLLVDPTHLHGYGLSVTVNGEKSNLLFDTGASGLVLNRNLAERAGVTRLSDAEFGGFGDKGDKKGYIGLANSIKIGQLEFEDCAVKVLDQRSIIGEDGLIGADVFTAFLVDIDFPNEKLHLGELPKRPEESSTRITLQTENDSSASTGEDPSENGTQHAGSAKNAAPSHSGPQDRYIAQEMRSYTVVYRFGHQLLIPTWIGDAPVKLFLIDTGSFSNLISSSAANEVTKVHSDKRTTVQGINGAVKDVYRADKAVIQFGHLRQRNQDMIAFDLTHMSDRIGTEVSGVLGFLTLRLLDIKIDYRDGLVDFIYDPERHGN